MRLKMLFEKKAFRITSLIITGLLICGSVFSIWIGVKSKQNKILNYPSEITVENNLISWNKVENAVGYRISINDDENEISESIFDLSKITKVKNYDVRIKTLGDRIKHHDSNWSQSITVTRLTTPELRITKTKLVWNQIDENNGYELYCNNKHLAHIKKDATEYDLLDVKLDCEFQIYAVGDGFYILNSLISEKVSANKLDSPSNLKMNGMVMSWDAVIGADKYLINSDVLQLETDNTSYDLKSIKPGVYNITVQAVSNSEDVLDSNKSDIKVTVEKKSLGSLNGVSIQENRLVWERLENAVGYKISIKQNQILYKEITESAAESFADLLEIGLSDGSYIIEIYALGNDVYKDSDKKTVSYVKTTEVTQILNLDDIKNAVINNGVLKWDSIPNASGYVVNMMLGNVSIHNTNIVGEDKLELDIPTLNLEPGNYTVMLYALGNTKYNNSPVISISYTVVRLEAPEALSYNGTQLIWNNVDNADGYRIIIGNLESLEVIGNTYNIILNPGAYNISVQAISNNREIQNSQITTLKYTEAKRDLGTVSNLKIEYGRFKWDPLEHSTGYIINIKNHESIILHTFEKAVANDREVDIYAVDLSLGDYIITIYALGDEFYNNTSEESTNYQEKMIRDAEVRVNFNYGNKYQDSSDYWVQHYLNFSLKQGFTFDNINVAQAEWNTVYTSFLAGSGDVKNTAAEAIGNDIIVTYYYKNDNGQDIVLLTTGNAPFVKNKLWGSWLWRYNGNAFTQLQGDITLPFSIGGIVPQAITLQVSANIGNKNPAGDNIAISSIQLNEIRGRVLYVDVDIIIKNGYMCNIYKETVSTGIM